MAQHVGDLPSPIGPAAARLGQRRRLRLRCHPLHAVKPINLIGKVEEVRTSATYVARHRAVEQRKHLPPR
ncbi:hypothetical protein GCM10010168_35700 [Actinoplanes ianthinogenes]|uniref:Uncharacterized protein n=1 Tax=Actinoplanes ianthinogenes TaxID=122358 RepID=A0ABN6CP47_9ACTN|nr:hypothetical protein Aiant_75670 [Actinoplanes ianthinogenes]GGR14702.1 hypothetical protein GCM10010168_35700 [Actinoplanes ianthinogenes]